MLAESMREPSKVVTWNRGAAAPFASGAYAGASAADCGTFFRETKAKTATPATSSAVKTIVAMRMVEDGWRSRLEDALEAWRRTALLLTIRESKKTAQKRRKCTA
jgi:hypothetical protein